MSYWNTKDFLRFIGNSLFHSRGTNYRLTLKRLGVLLLTLAIYLPAEFLIWSGLLLDEVFFPAYRQAKISQPVFIIGNPRSGTTFLQRLLARDGTNFLSMQAWEIFGAPSILMRKTAQLVVRAARTLGVRISRRIRKLERFWKESDRIHRLKLREPEEDEYLFIHIFSTMKIWSFAAMEEEAEPYIYYDDRLPEHDRYRIMDFYERCIQRHYYCHGENGKHYISKNPNFSPAIQTLLERFPDAKFIYLLRNPLKAIPSHISLKEREWQMLGSPLDKYACQDFIIRSSEHWYDYPLHQLSQLSEDQKIVIRFDDLISDTKRTVEEIYRRFGFDLTPEFTGLLEVESAMARKYKSKHHYDIEEMGVSSQALEDKFAGIINDYRVRK